MYAAYNSEVELFGCTINFIKRENGSEVHVLGQKKGKFPFIFIKGQCQCVHVHISQFFY